MNEWENKKKMFSGFLEVGHFDDLENKINFKKNFKTYYLVI